MTPEQRVCPGCERPVAPNTSECPYCGIVFDKARGATNTTSRPPQSNHPSTSSAVPDKRLFSRGFLIVAAVLVVLGASAGGYYYYGPCGLARIDEFGAELERLSQEWDDANEP